MCEAATRHLPAGNRKTRITAVGIPGITVEIQPRDFYNITFITVQKVDYVHRCFVA
jgi:hypothetical protein